MSEALQQLNEILYGKILLWLLLGAGLAFTALTGGIQFRGLRKALNVLKTPEKEGQLSNWGAIMVSTASRVGTGNIVGVSTAMCLGGVGSIFWLLLSCLLGAPSAFAEAVLAQLEKRRLEPGGCYGGPGLYIGKALGRGWGVLFCVLLLGTHGVGFNLLTAFNVQSALAPLPVYGHWGPWVVGLLLGISCFLALGKLTQVERICTLLVPVMGLGYTLLCLLALLGTADKIPTFLGEIFRDALNFRAISGGFGGSCLMLGLRRGLFSTEAGMGSGPNAAAAVMTAHPVTQGLGQMLSVYVDGLICLATAMLVMGSGISAAPELAGMACVSAAAGRCFGAFGSVFLAIAMILFGFSSLIGNMFYLVNALRCLGLRDERGHLAYACRGLISLSAAVGCVLSMELVWELADGMMAVICLLHLPVLLLRAGDIRRCLKDYEDQEKAGRRPVFSSGNFGGKCGDFWGETPSKAGD